MQTATHPATDFASARRAMIDSQLRTSGVNDQFVLERMAAVAREDFVPPAARRTAYIDRAVPLGGGRFLAAPIFHGRMLAEARPLPADRALVVDGGAGYLPELLRPLVAALEVISVAQAQVASRKRGAFTLLMIDGAVERIPETLVRRLDDAGRAVTGIVRNGVTRLALGRKAAGEIALWPLAEMGIPVLHDFDEPKGWSF